jgi:ABC-type uncharacterized transport system permease subunit
LPLAKLWAPRLLAFGVVVHLAHIVSASFLSHVCPVESVHFALSLSVWIAALAYLILARRRRIHAVGAFMAPAALTLMVAAQFVSVSEPMAQSTGVLLALHITASLIGVGLFLLAGAAAGFYLVQERRLKEKRIGASASKLPPLEALDTTEHRLLLVGFPLLTFGVVSGALFAGGLGASVAEVLRVLLALSTWILVAGVLVLRATVGWRGRRAAYGTLAGAVCVLLVIVVYILRPIAGGVS